MEVAGAARGGVEVMGGAGVWGCGGVVVGLVYCRGSKGWEVCEGGVKGRITWSLSLSYDRPLVSVFPGLVVFARCARVSLETAECIS